MVLDTLMYMESKIKQKIERKRCGEGDCVDWNQLKGQLERHQSKLEGEVVEGHSG